MAITGSCHREHSQKLCHLKPTCSDELESSRPSDLDLRLNWIFNLFQLLLSACQGTPSCCCHPVGLSDATQPARFQVKGRLLTRTLASDRTEEDLLKVLRGGATLPADLICYAVEKACADLRSKRGARVTTGSRACGRSSDEIFLLTERISPTAGATIVAFGHRC